LSFLSAKIAAGTFDIFQESAFAFRFMMSKAFPLDLTEPHGGRSAVYRPMGWV